MLEHLHYEPDDEAIEQAMQLHERSLTVEQLAKYEKYIAEIFSAVGMDLQTPATVETPRRFMRALLDMTEGYEGDPKLLKVFETECRGDPECRLADRVPSGVIRILGEEDPARHEHQQCVLLDRTGHLVDAAD